MAVAKTLGTTLVKTKNGNEVTDITVNKIISIGEIKLESEEIDITSLDSAGGFREFVGSVRDAGSIEISMNQDELNDDDFATLVGLSDLQRADDWTITFALAGGSTLTNNATWGFKAWVKSIGTGEVTVEGVRTAMLDLRITGQPTFTGAS